ncbi:cysteine desulfurase [Babesia ovata]|uniref:Cysteine desulfurase n=1 Tax=Babesia ovata TaxID=189622 RepID=A0A2H6KAQ8_9APIC|nr:cysteine desulfurase [Babesia ovata]GBE60084.1 cysteine desulfurase [Babesia ovata]
MPVAALRERPRQRVPVHQRIKSIRNRVYKRSHGIYKPSRRQLVVGGDAACATFRCSRDNVGPGDVILLPLSEHNSNIIPWQLHAEDSGCRVNFVKLTEDGSVDLDDYTRLLDQGNVKLVSLAHASNVIGRVQDLSTIVKLAHAHGAKVLVDACQTLGHIPIDVSSIGCDFLVGSAHKMYGPTGVGFLYAKRSILDSMRPFKGGGGMVKNVTTTWFELEDIPHRFESGTPQLAQVIGFSAAIDFVRGIGLSKIAEHERELLSYLRDQLCKVATVYSPPLDPNSDEHCPIVSFNVEGVSAFDVAALLATHNIAVRAGQHCAHILHRDYLKVEHSLRASLALYNSRAEIDEFVRTGGDSILRVNPRLVPSKQLGKTLLRIGTLGMDRAKLERILLTCATQMGQALDDVNLTTCLSLMVRLQISNPQCLESLVPYCYRISDLERAIACCHLIGMVPGSRDSPSARVFVVHVSQRVPLEGHSLLLRDLGRLCESLRVLDLYCEDLGEFLASVIEDELVHSKSSDDMVFITSVLGYLGRMGIGSVSLWRLFSRYTAAEGLHSNPRVLLKALESFCDRRIKQPSLLNQAGDALAYALDSLRPSEVARVADVYSRLGFYHKRLAEALILGAERVIPFLDASDSVKLLRTFLQAYSQPGTYAAITQDPALSHRHRRALYLTFNRCTTGLNNVSKVDLLVITSAMQLLPITPPASLQNSIRRLLVRATGSYVEPCAALATFAKAGIQQSLPSEASLEHAATPDSNPRHVRYNSKQLAVMALAAARRRRLQLNSSDAVLISRMIEPEAPSHI